MKLLRNIFLFFSLTLFWACADDHSLSSPLESDMRVSFSAVPVREASAGTRSVSENVDEGLDDDYVVSDFWLFQYNQNGVLIGRPAYYRTEAAPEPELSVSVLKPSAAGVSYKTVFIANTHDNSLKTKIRYNTLDELKASGILVSSSRDLYQEGYNDLMMNGVVEITSETTSIDCALYRNVAKLALNISNEANSGITIKSVQLKSVNNKLFFADHLYDGDDQGGEVAVPGSSEVTFVDFELDEIELAEGQSAKLLYYLSRNMRGQNSATDPKAKNENAPAYSSYLEVRAVHNDRNTPVRYRFYLGKNNYNDFNVEPNYRYDISLTFNNMGGSDDNRVEDLSVVLLGDSNSHIIQPMSTNVGIKYTVPAAVRINKFWQSDAGRQADDWEAHCIDGSNAWVAEVLWQDIKGKQVIKFCQEDGSLADQYAGAADEVSFSFVLTNDAVGSMGNILVGVRSADGDWTQEDGYMWSWHIWITDYDPDESVGSWVDGKYAYQVPGGNIHKYPSFEAIPMYSGKYIMDRNLGATRAESYEGMKREHVIQANGTYYAYGRKDPFPGPVKIYDIEGVEKNFSDGNEVDQRGMAITQGPGAIHASVRAPYKYYSRNDSNNSGEDWAADNKWQEYDWNDIDKASGGKGKSFFDPCPDGWKLPHYSVFDSFGSNTEVYAANCHSWTDLTLNEFGEYLGWQIYLSGEEGWNSKEGDIVYFPASNLIAHGTGTISGVGGLGGLWSSDPNGANGHYLYYANEVKLLFSNPRPYFRYLGFPVRCIQE